MSLECLSIKQTTASDLKRCCSSLSSLCTGMQMSNMLSLGEGQCITTNIFIISSDWNIRVLSPLDPYVGTSSLYTMHSMAHPFLATRGSKLNPVSWHSPEHITAASSLCPQSLCPQDLAGQSHREDSFPLHFTSLSHMGPVPGPNAASLSAFTAEPQPSCRQTTWALSRFQESSHTVPQEPSCQTSTRPEQVVFPSWSLILSEKSETPRSFMRR